jgi:uncharacterized low-complexity protein
MKKFIIAAAVVMASALTFSSCTKENVKPASNHVNTVAEKGDVAQGDIAPSTY